MCLLPTVVNGGDLLLCMFIVIMTTSAQEGKGDLNSFANAHLSNNEETHSRLCRCFSRPVPVLHNDIEFWFSSPADTFLCLSFFTYKIVMLVKSLEKCFGHSLVNMHRIRVLAISRSSNNSLESQRASPQGVSIKQGPKTFSVGANLALCLFL